MRLEVTLELINTGGVTLYRSASGSRAISVMKYREVRSLEEAMELKEQLIGIVENRGRKNKQDVRKSKIRSET